VAEIAGLWSAGGGGRLGPSKSRIRFPGVGVEAAVALRNKSSQALPRPSNASLWHLWRACGGGAPGVELLCRSRSATSRQPGREVSVSAFSFVDGEAALGYEEDWKVDKARWSCGSVCRRWRTLVHGQWSSGCIPGRCGISDGFIPSVKTGVYCGYLQSLMARGSFRPGIRGGGPPVTTGGSKVRRSRPVGGLGPYVQLLCSLGTSMQLG
jgi:hypothetical protein